MKHTTAMAAAITAAAGGMLAACTSSPYGLNKELAIGEGDPRHEPYRPQAFESHPAPGLSASGRPAPAQKVGPATTEEAKAPEPSVVSIDRSNWEILRVEVPNDRAAHQPIYTRSLTENDEIARNRGLYPTTSTANQVTHPTSQDAQILEAVEAPFAAAADIILFLPRAFVNAPWDPVRTGFEPYRRVPGPRASASPVVTTPKPPAPTGKPGVADPAAAPVQVPLGEYLPAAPSAGTPQTR